MPSRPPTSGEPAGARLVRLPLRGEWTAVRSPATRVPSHGTDLLGQRYAFDFARPVQPAGERPRPVGGLAGVLLGVRTRDWPGWGELVVAPLDGDIVAAVDGVGERSRVHPLREAAIALWTTLTFRPTAEGVRRLVGNHVVVRHGDVWSVAAHLAPGSVAVRPGQHVLSGAPLGRVGHSGNSTAPHLHFQLMDSADPIAAHGVPCVFEAYEVERGGQWLRVEGGVPGAADRIRAAPGEVPR